MTGELDRGYAEGINENDLQRRTARGEKINLVGTDVIKHNGDIHTSDGRYEPQRQEYLELIHLMNQKTKQILENGLEAMTQAEHDNTIHEYRAAIASLTKLNEDYKSVMQDFDAECVVAEMEVREIISTLIGKKIG